MHVKKIAEQIKYNGKKNLKSVGVVANGRNSYFFIFCMGFGCLLRAGLFKPKRLKPF